MSTSKRSTYRPGVVALRNSLGVHSFINREGGVEYDVTDGPGGRWTEVEVTDPILVHRPNPDDDDEDDDDDDFEGTELTRGKAKDKITIKSNREAYHRSKHLEIHVRKTEGGWRSSVNSKEPLIPDSLKSRNKTFGSISGSHRFRRIHIRNVGDLERILPPSGSSCQRLLLTTVLVLCSVVVYVVVMVAILKGIGGY